MQTIDTNVKATNGGFDTAPVDTVVSAKSTVTLVPVRDQPRRRYQARGRRFRHGDCAAARPAVTGAQAHLRGEFSSLVEAADAHGSCPQYVAYAVIVVQGGNFTLLHDVLEGNILLREAAEMEKNIVRLQVAYEQASADERVRFGRRVGVGALWDDCISPAL